MRDDANSTAHKGRTFVYPKCYEGLLECQPEDTIIFDDDLYYEMLCKLEGRTPKPLEGIFPNDNGHVIVTKTDD